MRGNSTNKRGNEVENGQKLEKISKVKSWIFEKISKTDKCLARIIN